MEARIIRCAIAAASLLSVAAGYRTPNFIVSAKSPQLAAEVAQAAEEYRRQLAVDWLGRELPRWSEPCPIWVTELPFAQGGEGAGGATSFTFIQGQPRAWRMNIQGSRQRVLDSVLPHEVLHTVFATHFGQPLPRWADEGACTTVEHDSEKAKHYRMLHEFLGANRGIPFNQMFAMTEYPQDILPLYSQGFSVARYLIAQGGKRTYVDFVGDGLKSGNWSETLARHYQFRNLSELQLTWNRWVVDGSPPLAPRENSALADLDDSPSQSPFQSPSQSPAQLAKFDSTLDADAKAGLVESRESASDGWYSRQAAEARRRRPGAASAGLHERSPSGREQAVTRPLPPQGAQPYVLESSRGGYSPGSVGWR